MAAPLINPQQAQQIGGGLGKLFGGDPEAALKGQLINSQVQQNTQAAQATAYKNQGISALGALFQQPGVITYDPDGRAMVSHDAIPQAMGLALKSTGGDVNAAQNLVNYSADAIAKQNLELKKIQTDNATKPMTLDQQKGVAFAALPKQNQGAALFEPVNVSPGQQTQFAAAPGYVDPRDSTQPAVNLNQAPEDGPHLQLNQSGPTVANKFLVPPDQSDASTVPMGGQGQPPASVSQSYNPTGQPTPPTPPASTAAPVSPKGVYTNPAKTPDEKTGAIKMQRDDQDALQTAKETIKQIDDASSQNKIATNPLLNIPGVGTMANKIQGAEGDPGYSARIQRTALANTIILEGRKNMPGSMSDADREFLMSAAPRPGDADSVWQDWFQRMRGVTQRKADLLQQRIDGNGASSGSNFTPAQSSGPANFSQYDSLPSGSTYTDPNGNVRRKK